MITFILAVCGNVDYVYSFPLSPPSRAAWIEISMQFRPARQGLWSPPSRAAWIEIAADCFFLFLRLSPPSRAAWIEIAFRKEARCSDARRRLHGRRGLKSFDVYNYTAFFRRRLHGRRGFKYAVLAALCRIKWSPPSRAAWIEMSYDGEEHEITVSPPSRAAWIEMSFTQKEPSSAGSPPSGAAWIEISKTSY